MNENEVQSNKVDSKESRANGFNKANFTIASLADDSRRYYSNGILVTNEKTEVTNGHYLLSVTTPRVAVDDYPSGPNGHNPIDKEFRFILSKEAAQRIEKSIPKMRQLPILENAWITEDTKETTTFITTDLDNWTPIQSRKIDGKFPDTDSVYPEGEPVIELGMNLDYLEKLCKTLKKIIGKSKVDPLAKFTFYGPERPVKIECDNIDTDQKASALLMPCKA